MALDYRASDAAIAGPSRELWDVDMQDAGASAAAGPSTAPLQGGNKTFFHEE